MAWADIGLVFAVLGLVFGSFATALCHRLPRGLPIVNDRSRCPHCRTTLGAVDLLPVFSWLLSRGRCRHCGEPISWRYPVIEAVMAALFLLAWWRSEGDLIVAALLALTALGLVVIVVVDLEEGIIPDAVLLGLLPLAVAWRWRVDADWLDAGLGAALGFLLTLAVRIGFRAWRRKEGLGLGDVKFLGVAGIYVGLSGLGGFLLLSGLLGLVLGLGWRWSGRGAVFPFGPALCAALLLGVFDPSLLWGMVNW
jgi:prepilin signal peptidase PulO-like enzyme (type II secretory pathway)